jgi:hypothetical protein
MRKLGLTRRKCEHVTVGVLPKREQFNELKCEASVTHLQSDIANRDSWSHLDLKRPAKGALELFGESFRLHTRRAIVSFSRAMGPEFPTCGSRVRR